jgi:hypothetical protein
MPPLLGLMLRFDSCYICCRSVDSLFELSPGLFHTMEDYIWAKLSFTSFTCV